LTLRRSASSNTTTPLGRSIRLGATDERTHSASELIADGPSYQVAGVVRDARGSEFDGSDSKQIYLPLANDRPVPMNLMLPAHGMILVS